MRLFSIIGVTAIALSTLAWPVAGSMVLVGIIAGLLYLAAGELHKHTLFDDRGES